MEYFVFIKDNKEGCDYTIGCGMIGKFWEAENEFDLYLKLTDRYNLEELEELFWVSKNSIHYFNSTEIEEYKTYLKLKKKFE